MARKIEVLFVGDAASLERAAAKSALALKAVDSQASTGGKNWLSWSNALKYAVPAIAGVGVAVLGLTGNMAALAPIIPIVTAALGFLLAPLASLAAVIVALIGPISLLIGLLGILGGAFALTAVKAFGRHSDGLGQAVLALKGQFETLITTLIGRFMPVFQFLIRSASDLLGYFNKLAKMPLAQAFHNLATTGVAGLTKFLEKVGHIIAKPIRLAFRFAFGGPGQSVDNQLGKLWNQVLAFFSKAPPGGQSIDSMVMAWFGRHDFTKTGARWGQELASGVMQAFGTALSHLFMSSGGKAIGVGALAGGGIGAVVGGPLGAAIGVAAGAAFGEAFNHYVGTHKLKAILDPTPKQAQQNKKAVGSFLGNAWKQDVADAKLQFGRLFDGIRTGVKYDAGAIKSLLGAAWRAVASVARQVWAGVSKVARTELGTTANAVKSLVGAAWRWISNLVGGILGGIAHNITSKMASAWNAVRGIAQSVWNFIRSLFSSVLSVHISWPSPPGWLTSLLSGAGGVLGTITGSGGGGGLTKPPAHGGHLVGAAMTVGSAPTAHMVDHIYLDGQKVATIVRNRLIKNSVMSGQPALRGLA